VTEVTGSRDRSRDVRVKVRVGCGKPPKLYVSALFNVIACLTGHEFNRNTEFLLHIATSSTMGDFGIEAAHAKTASMDHATLPANASCIRFTDQKERSRDFFWFSD
jgi:hypothetical protein